jgi:IclR family acetate operon transcriptional repressor
MGAIARDTLRAIWEKTEETVADDRRVCIAELPSPQVLSFKRGVGYSDEISIRASGRAILAFSDDDSRQRLLIRMSPGDKARLEEELARTWQREIDGEIAASSHRDA